MFNIKKVQPYVWYHTLNAEFYTLSLPYGRDDESLELRYRIGLKDAPDSVLYFLYGSDGRCMNAVSIPLDVFQSEESFFQYSTMCDVNFIVELEFIQYCYNYLLSVVGDVSESSVMYVKDEVILNEFYRLKNREYKE